MLVFISFIYDFKLQPIPIQLTFHMLNPFNYGDSLQALRSKFNK